MYRAQYGYYLGGKLALQSMGKLPIFSYFLTLKKILQNTFFSDMLENNVFGTRSVTYNYNNKIPDPSKIGISEQKSS